VGQGWQREREKERFFIKKLKTEIELKKGVF
jgi:hypothetical protein